MLRVNLNITQYDKNKLRLFNLMPYLYDYSDHKGLTPSDLLFFVAIDQTLKQLGGGDVIAAAAILSGQPILPTRAKFGGSTKGTSIASVVSRNLIKTELPFRLPTISGSSLGSLKLTFTKRLGAFVGRLVPGVGWVILAYDVVQIMHNTITEYNRLVRPQDKVW